MATKQDRLLQRLFNMDGFTARELAERSGVNLNTVRSWLQRQLSDSEPLVRVAGRENAEGRGQPQFVWKKTEGANDRIQRGFDILGNPLTETATQTELRVLDEAVRAINAFADSRDMPEADAQLAEARGWFDRAERVCAFIKTQGGEVPGSVVERLEQTRLALSNAEAWRPGQRFVDRFDDDAVLNLGRLLFDCLEAWLGDDPAARRYNPLYGEYVREDAAVSVALCEAAQSWPTSHRVKFAAAVLIALGIYCEEGATAAGDRRDALRNLWITELHLLSQKVSLENAALAVRDSFFRPLYLDCSFEERVRLLGGCTIVCAHIGDLGAFDPGVVDTSDQKQMIGGIFLVEVLQRLTSETHSLDDDFAPALFFTLERVQPRRGLSVSVADRSFDLRPWQEVKTALTASLLRIYEAKTLDPIARRQYLGDRRSDPMELARCHAEEAVEPIHKRYLKSFGEKIEQMLSAAEMLRPTDRANRKDPIASGGS